MTQKNVRTLHVLDIAPVGFSAKRVDAGCTSSVLDCEGRHVMHTNVYFVCLLECEFGDNIIEMFIRD